MVQKRALHAAGPIDLDDPDDWLEEILCVPRVPLDVDKHASLNASFSFESVTSGRSLPSALASLPVEFALDLVLGGRLLPKGNYKDVHDEGGVWSFKGWSPVSCLMNDDDLTFTGMWEWEASDTTFLQATVIPEDPAFNGGYPRSTQGFGGVEPRLSDGSTKGDDASGADGVMPSVARGSSIFAASGFVVFPAALAMGLAAAVGAVISTVFARMRRR